MLFTKIMILLTLLVIFIQDIKTYAVYWFLFPVLAFLLTLLQYERNYTFLDIWSAARINIAFVALQLLLLSGYFSLKNKRLTNITDELLGWGDILLLLSITVYLSVLNFLAFYILSLVFILLAVLISQLFSLKRNREIPLAGLQAVLLMVVFSCDWWINHFNLADDAWLLNLITK